MTNETTQKFYYPSEEVVKNAAVSGMEAYKALCAEAEQDYEGFWGKRAKELIDWQTPFTQVLDESNAPFFKWFADGKLNVSYNCLDRQVNKGLGDKVATEQPILCLAQPGRWLGHFELSRVFARRGVGRFFRPIGVGQSVFLCVSRFFKRLRDLLVRGRGRCHRLRRRIAADRQRHAARQILERDRARLDIRRLLPVGLAAQAFVRILCHRLLLSSERVCGLCGQMSHLPLQLLDLLLEDAYATARADDEKKQENRATDEEQAGKKDHGFHAWRPTNGGGGDYYMRMLDSPVGTITRLPCLGGFWRFPFIMPA